MSATANRMSPERTSFIFAGFYFLFYFMVSVNIAFLPLHFRSLGCTSWQIAVLSAGMSISSLLAAPFFGRLLSQLPSGKPLLLGSLATAVLAFSPMLFLQSFPWMLPCYFIYLHANAGIAVVIDTQAVRRGLSGEMSFERVRLWGSVGFVLASIGLGVCVERWGPDIIVPAAVVSLLMTATAGYLGRETLGTGGVVIHAPGAPARALRPFHDLPREVWIILGAVMLVWASHGALYVYFSLYVRTLGWTGNELALAWNIGVGVEILMFAIYHHIRRWRTPRRIFVSSAVATMIRWAVLSLTTSKPLILLSQVLHGWSFGLCYLSAITLLHERLPEAYRTRGQAWLSAWGSGAGSLGGRIVFGLLAGELATPAAYQRLYLWAVGIAACGCIVAMNLRAEPSGRLPGQSS